jgi:hypothetical protein
MEQAQLHNDYEQQARLIKARKLIEFFNSQGITAEQASTLDDESWNAAADLAHVNEPSIATRTLVTVQMSLEAPVRPADPFAGFPKLNEESQVWE